MFNTIEEAIAYGLKLRESRDRAALEQLKIEQTLAQKEVDEYFDKALQLTPAEEDKLVALVCQAHYLREAVETAEEI